MKETKIAKENIKKLSLITFKKNEFIARKVFQTHKQTCQRWLEFLEGYVGEIYGSDDLNLIVYTNFEKKIKDLKQAIKLYNEVGK